MEARFPAKKQVIRNFLTAKKRYLPKEKTNAQMGNLLKCTLCPNMCRFDCPVATTERSEAFSPSVKARIAYLLETGKLEPSGDSTEPIYKCLNCDACERWCPFGFSLGDLLMGVKEDLVERGFSTPNARDVVERLEKNHTIYEDGVRSFGEATKNRAEILYFGGCTTLNRRTEVVKSTTDILESAGVDFTMLQDEWCCGAPLYMLGHKKTFENFVAHNIRAFKDTGCKTILCSCPECVYTIRTFYPKSKIRIMHTSEFFAELIKERKIGNLELKGEFTFHDPCVLSRKLGVYEEPRDILKSISGLTLKETYFNKEDTNCCGLGGALGMTNPQLAREISQKRAAELKESSDSVISACPACEFALENWGRLKAMDISEILYRGMKNGRR